MTDRQHCCVPECRRSFPHRDRQADVEIMCGRCWRTADAKLRYRDKQSRARYRRIERLERRKAIKAKRSDGRFYRIYQVAFRLWLKGWKALVEDVKFKSAMRLEGTAGELASRRHIPRKTTPT